MKANICERNDRQSSFSSLNFRTKSQTETFYLNSAILLMILDSLHIAYSRILHPLFLRSYNAGAERRMKVLRTQVQDRGGW